MRFKERKSWVGGVEGGSSVVEPIYDTADAVEGVVMEIPEIKPFGEGVEPGKEVMLPRTNLNVVRPPTLPSTSSEEK